MEELHPNWRALASTSFQRKLFVKADDEESSKAKDKEKVRLDFEPGFKSDEFYQKVLDEPSSSNNTPVIKQRLRKPGPSKIKINLKSQPVQFKLADLFKAAQNDEVDFVKSALEGSHDKNIRNAQDSFGWTLIMIASKAGALRVVQYLCDLKVLSFQIHSWKCRFISRIHFHFRSTSR